MFVVTCLWVVAIKKGCDFLDQGTLKSAISQEWFDEMI